MKNFIIVALCALCIVLLMFRSCERQTDKIILKTDTVTLIRTDTLRLTNVVYRDRWHIRNDTVLHIAKGDTIYVPIPIDRYLFTDDSTYRAEVSGYNVSLDRMEVYRRTLDRTITIDKLIKPKPKRFGLGIHAGYGINTSGQLRPYVGIGVSFNFVRF